MSLVVDRNRISRLETDVRRLVQGQQPRQIGETAPPAAGGDHGALTGLADDDHTQYLTAARGGLLFQPLDSDLSAIAALTTTAFGRALLELANSAAMSVAAFSGLPLGNTTTPDEIVVKQGGVWVRLTWATFLTIVNGAGSASLDFSQASNSQYIGAVYL